MIFVIHNAPPNCLYINCIPRTRLLAGLYEAIDNPVEKVLRTSISHVEDTLPADPIVDGKPYPDKGDSELSGKKISLAAADDDVDTDLLTGLQHGDKNRYLQQYAALPCCSLYLP